MNVQRKEPRVPVPDRDRSIENALRRVLSDDVRAQPQSTCPDAETIAAWHEGTLRRDEAVAIENHVADCAHCRALMAAFVQAAPATPAVESIWRRWHLGWAVPLATAATAAALWIAIPQSTPSPQVEVPEEKTASVAQPPSSTSPVTPTAPAAAAEPRAVQNAAALAKTAAILRDEARRRADESQVAREQVANQQAADAAPAGAAPAGAAQAGAASAGAALSARLEADRQARADNAAAPRPLAVAARLAASPSLEIVAPGGSGRWRIIGGQQVEWSTSAAAEWGPAALESPDALTAGAAPSPSVCWIVGRRGAIYVTTDGRRFMRVPFPEMADLVKVTATDDRTATVSSADGRSWNTSDQGKSWAIGR